MRSIRKLTLAAVLAFAMVAALALPASALSADVVVFRGSATLTVPLTFPGVGPAQTGSWSFSAPNPSTPVASACASVGTGGVGSDLLGNCSISASGDLGEILGSAAPVNDSPTPLGLGLGAWCGISGGWGGSGNATVGTDSGSLSDVGWTTSAGSVLPVTGNVTDQDGDGGALVALVQASGANLASECALGGTTHFDVNGVAAVVAAL